MVLEDLTLEFKSPSILDLKLGIRQFVDDAPEEKKRSQSLKCQNSMTKSLGFRPCGMMVNNNVDRRFDNYFRSTESICKNLFFMTSTWDEKSRILRFMTFSGCFSMMENLFEWIA